jgi:hypothetical protein
VSSVDDVAHTGMRTHTHVHTHIHNTYTHRQAYSTNVHMIVLGYSHVVCRHAGMYIRTRGAIVWTLAHIHV